MVSGRWGLYCGKVLNGPLNVRFRPHKPPGSDCIYMYIHVYSHGCLLINS